MIYPMPSQSENIPCFRPKWKKLMPLFRPKPLKNHTVSSCTYLQCMAHRYIWVMDQVWFQNGWILAQFFFVCSWTETESRSINSQKKNRGQYPAILTKQAWSIKDLLYGFRRKFSCGTQQVVLSRQDSSILPAQVANHSAGFDLSCPLMELAIQ